MKKLISTFVRKTQDIHNLPGFIASLIFAITTFVFGIYLIVVDSQFLAVDRYNTYRSLELIIGAFLIVSLGGLYYFGGKVDRSRRLSHMSEMLFVFILGWLGQVVVFGVSRVLNIQVHNIFPDMYSKWPVYFVAIGVAMLIFIVTKWDLLKNKKKGIKKVVGNTFRSKMIYLFTPIIPLLILAFIPYLQTYLIYISIALVIGGVSGLATLTLFED